MPNQQQKIPNGWKKIRLKEVSKIYDGTHQTPNYVEQGIPFYSVEHITANDFSSTKYISEAVYEAEIRKVKIEKGDILMSRIGDIGTARYIDWDVKASFYVTLALIKLIDTQKVNTKALSFIINSSSFRREMWKRTLHVAFPNKINLGDIGECEFMLPSFPEQKRIAQVLETWDKYLSLLDQKIKIKNNIKKALTQNLLTGKIRLKGFSQEWKTAKLGALEDLKIIKLGRGEVISKTDIKNFPGENPIYSSSVHNNALFGRYSKYMFDEELISWSIDGGGHFFYRPKHKFSITNVSGFIRINTKILNYKFLASQLQLLHSKKYFDYQFKAHPSVIREEYYISYPNIEEQKAIANIIITAEREIEALEKQQQIITEQKKFLLNNLITGQIRLPEFVKN